MLRARARSGRGGGAAALAGVHRYPDPSYMALRSALSARYGVSKARIALGNGSCDILLSAGEALLEPGAEVVYSWPAFSVYPHLAAASGARAIEVALDAEDRHDLDAMAAEITVATRLVLICNPNNPTSTSLPAGGRRGLHGARAPPRVRDPRRGLLRNLPWPWATPTPRSSCCAAGRTWSCCGPSPRPTASPGCASATGCAAPRTSGPRSTRSASPSTSTWRAQAAAVEALRHQDEVERRVTHTVGARLELIDGLRRLGLWVADSDANFVWTHLPEESVEADVVTGLRERGVLVRAGGAARSRAVRCGSRSAPTRENERFLAAMAELV